MKKLMVLAAVAIVAAMSQAAEVKWGTGALKMVDADGNWTSTTASKALIASITATAHIYDASGTELYTSTITAFPAMGSSVTGTWGDNFEFSTAYKASLEMVVDFGNGGTQTFLNDEAVASFTTKGTGATTINFTSLGIINTSTAGQWTAAPEPTSGLLLLLGVAGLALRRRRA